MPKPTTVYFVEHGLTPKDGTEQEVVHGWGKARLTEAGKARMAETAAHLQGKAIGEVYSSDLPRAVESAELLREALHVKHPLTTRRGLRPMNIGVFAGQPKAEVQEALGDLKARRWANAPGGGSYGQFLHTFGRELARDLEEAQAEDSRCVYVTHSHNLGALAHLLSGGKAKATLDSPVGGGGILAVDVAPDGRAALPSVVWQPGTEGE